ncbi:MAG TPA: S9 family peptidase [Candidatus Acidoferrales bacterium]|nr:S9 family peptidase [Candidatus Acidoferrales bacterium]
MSQSNKVASAILVGIGLSFALFLAPAPALAQQDRLQSSDLSRFRDVGEVAISPDGKQIAYAVINYDRPGRPYPQLWVMDVASGKSARLGGDGEVTSDAVWSPDGRWISYSGEAGGKNGLFIAHPDGSDKTFLAETQGTNSPLPGQGSDVSWSPDSKQIAFISATPGPETADATGDPMVFTRYLWRPTAGEGIKPWNDNRRLHIFVVDIASKRIRQLTDGDYYEHSIDWSPDGSAILFCSDRSPYADQFFHYNIYAVNPASGAIRQVTTFESTQYDPVWSPDGKRIAFRGTKRGLTDRETTMEDTHVWVMNADGSDSREIGASIDDRQGAPQWSADGRSIYFTVQDRGSNHLYRLSIEGGKPDAVVNDSGGVGSFSVSKSGAIAYSFTGARDMSELFLKAGESPKQLTNLNEEVLRGKQVSDVESFDFISNDNKYNVEAFIVKPLELLPGSKHPLIVNIHGGPHGQNGPEFNFRDQVFAARGWAVLHVNYRGSTGYGQAFADAVFGDQNGNEAQDVLYGVSAAIRRYPWIDPSRMGVEGVSYGGQLSYWLITQTREFKAAIPIAGITNLISYNYLTYYNQYEQMEFGALPHQDDLMDTMWKRSAIRYVAQVTTPTLIMHGANDPDVPIPDAEQFYIALKDVGVETEFVMYPREGHGIREVKHQIDSIDRSIAWYEKHFPDKSAAVPIP